VVHAHAPSESQARAGQLDQLSKAATAAAIQSVPRMAKIRVAMATLLGA